MKKPQSSEKIPKEILYVRWTSLGIELIKPSTILETVALKLCIGSKRAKNRIDSLLSIIEELQFIENRIN